MKIFPRIYYYLTKHKFFASVVIIIGLIASVVGIFGQKPALINPVNSPGSINTVGQTGSNLILNQKNIRHFGEAEKVELQEFLPTEKSTTIQVWYLMGDAEAKNYAMQLKSYLESEKWNVDPFLGSFDWFEPVVGVNVIKPDANKLDPNKWRFEVGSAP